MNDDQSARRYRPDIDGLRALAVTAVVLFHAGVAPFASGFTGVDIFFVISGYLIGGIIARDAAARRFSFAGFYARRARRILPALIAVITVSCAAGYALLDAAELRGLGATAVTALLAMSNISFWHYQDYFAADSRLSPLLMTWSLGVEEQFYCCFPLIVLAVLRWRPRLLFAVVGAITLASFLFSLWATWHAPATGYYLLPARAWELGIGVMLAVGEINRRAAVTENGRLREALGWAGLIALVAGACGFDEHVPFPGFMALLPVLGAAALIAAKDSFVNRRLLALRPVVFIGLISYSWYLWHWPLFSFLRILFFNAAPPAVMAAAVLLSFGLAVLSWRFIEQPFRHARNPAGKTLLRYGCVLCVASLFPLAAKLTDGLPRRLNPQTHAIEATVALGRGNCLALFDVAAPDTSPDCVAPVAGRPTLALIGDSHAAALGPGLRALAARRNDGVEIFTKSSCPPLLGVTVRSRARPTLAATCGAFMEAAFKRVAGDPAVGTVYLTGYWSSPFADDNQRFVALAGPQASNEILMREGLRRAVTTLTAAGKQVVVVQDVPHWKFNPVLAALAAAMPLRRHLADSLWQAAGRAPPFAATGERELVYWPDEDKTAHDLVAQAADWGATVADPHASFCPKAPACRFMQGDELLYIDLHHVSAAGSLIAAGALP